MINKLVVVALGDRNSGKSTTWHSLFNLFTNEEYKRSVNTGKRERRLYLSETEYTYVYLINGSPQERKTLVSKIIQGQTPNIVCCSIQYVEDAKETIDYFIEHEYQFFVHWLNPGFNHTSEIQDTLGLKSYILKNEKSQFFIKNGKKEDLEHRISEIKEFLYIWADEHKLLHS
jgi:GTPase SAR1 family protein